MEIMIFLLNSLSKEAANSTDLQTSVLCKTQTAGYPFHMYPWIPCRL